jgi:hypothetical protein
MTNEYLFYLCISLCIFTPSHEPWKKRTIPAAKSTANMPVKNMPSNTPTPPIDSTSGFEVCNPTGERAGRTAGVRIFIISAPKRVPIEPLIYASDGAPQ